MLAFLGDLQRYPVFLWVGRHAPRRLEISDHVLQGLSVRRCGQLIGAFLGQGADEVLG